MMYAETKKGARRETGNATAANEELAEITQTQECKGMDGYSPGTNATQRQYSHGCAQNAQRTTHTPRNRDNKWR